MADETDRLVRLKTLKGHKVASGDHDIRGWDVVTSDHKRVGTVDDLVVDRDAMRVRYFVIRVDHKLLDTKADSHMLLPIAGAALDPGDKRVYLEDIDSERLLAIPPYDHRRITREYERTVRDLFRSNERDATRRTEQGDFYDHPAYQEGRMYQRRRTDSSDIPAPADPAATTPVDAEVDERLRRERIEEAERLRRSGTEGTDRIDR